MVTRPVVVAVICVGLFIIFDALVTKAMAQRTSNMNDFRMDDQRTHKRRNYILQRGRDKEILGSLDNIGVTYDIGPLDAAGRNPEDLSAFIVDYANMIDDVILLDKSVETRTRKRDNIKLEKYSDNGIADPPCYCKSIPDSIELGDDTFPRRVETRICAKDQNNGCAAPYACQAVLYEIPVLKKKSQNTNLSRDQLIPNILVFNWAAELKNVSIGCECKGNYVTERTG